MAARPKRVSPPMDLTTWAELLGKLRGATEAASKGATDAAAIANQQATESNAEIRRLHDRLDRYADRELAGIQRLAAKDEEIRRLEGELERERARDKMGDAALEKVRGQNVNVSRGITALSQLAFALMGQGAEAKRLRDEVREFLEGLSDDALWALREDNPERFAALVRRLEGRTPKCQTDEIGEAKPNGETAC